MKHHADCDGWRMHNVKAKVEHHAFGTVTYVPWCTSCDAPVPDVVGSAGSKETAVAMGRHHNAYVPCVGECLAWEGSA